VAQTNLEKAFLGVYEAHADAIFRYCYFKLSDRELAQDAAQEVFLRYWRYISGGKQVAFPQAFLFTTAGNYVKDQYRKKKTVPMSALDSPEDDQPFDVADESGDQTRDAEYKLALRSFAALPDDDRLLLQLRFVEDLGVKDIATLLVERENTIAVRISRALAQLRQAFEKHE